MNKFEINKAIAELVYDMEFERYTPISDSVCPVDISLNLQIIADYCNNWNDLMPLVIEHGIDLICQDGGKRGVRKWKALVFIYGSYGEFNEDFHVCHKNPQLALAECLLKVLQAKQEKL